MFAIAIPVGLLVGLALGALGGGGSVLTVPALVYLLDQSPHAATTGSLLIVGVTALTGMVAHWRAGRVRVVQGVVFGVLGVAGSLLGSRLSANVDPNLLLAAFAVLMTAAAFAMLRRARTRGEPPKQPPEPPPADPAARQVASMSDRSPVAVLDQPRTATTTCTLPSATPRIDTCRAIRVVAAATVVGLLTGFFGVGGGFVIVPALVLVLGFDMPAAVGTSLLVVAINSAAALSARLGGAADLDWPLLGLFSLVAIAGSFAGNRIASRVDARRLTVAFTVLLLAVAGYTAVRSVPHLF